MSTLRLDRLLSNLGYCSRGEVAAHLREGAVTHVEGKKLTPSSHVTREEILFDGSPLDPPQGLVLALNKPCGYSCTYASDEGDVIYDLLPERYAKRNPKLASVGRLDRDTSGLLLLTDDGTLLHKITSPSYHVKKIYEVELRDPLQGDEATLFASGTLVLEGEDTPLAPAELKVLGPKSCHLTIGEGRYHQVRRMFEAKGNLVVALRRLQIGGLSLPELPEGEYRILGQEELSKVFQ